jgi:hypothetical protein
VRTPQWEKKLGGHAGELFVAAELSKRGIPNALLPENFTGDDIIAGAKDGDRLCFIQVKACHPDRSSSFLLNQAHEGWLESPANHAVVFVWLGSPRTNDPPRYCIASRSDVGRACVQHSAHGTSNWERRFAASSLPTEWLNNWDVITGMVGATPTG